MLTLLNKNSKLIGADRFYRLTRIATHYLSALILTGINQRGLVMSKNKSLSQERLKELLSYNPSTGIFIRVKDIKANKSGTIVGSLTRQGYLRMSIDNNPYLLHRLAFLYMDGYFPENDIDHINRDTLDNRWDNLRHVSHACNMRNSKVRNTNKSGVNGVAWHKAANKWCGSIMVNYKSIHLGISGSFCEVVKARWEAEKEHNFPNCNTTSSAFIYLKGQGLT